MYAAYPLTPAEERTIVREPAQAVPEAVAKRLGKVRVLVVPYLICSEAGDSVSTLKPEGETHTAVWLEASDQINLVLAGRELKSVLPEPVCPSARVPDARRPSAWQKF